MTGLVLLYTQAISWSVIICRFFSEIMTFSLKYTEYKIVTLPVSRFASVGLLPEQPDGPRSPFPVSRLEAQYREKRSV